MSERTEIKEFWSELEDRGINVEAVKVREDEPFSWLVFIEDEADLRKIPRWWHDMKITVEVATC